MKQRQWMISTTCALAMLTNSVGALAQGAPQEKQPPKREQQTAIERREVFVAGQEVDGILLPAPHPAEMMIGQSGEGSVYNFEGFTYKFVSSEMSFGGKVVKDAPYSAEAVTETVQVLGDGNRIVRKSTTSVYRDSEGRTRRDQALGAIGPWAAVGDPPQTIFINDPVSGVNYILDPRTHTARKVMVSVLRDNRGGEPSAATSNSAAKKLSGGVLQGSAIKKVQPTYPPVAKAAGAQGPVQVQILINEAGEVDSAVVLSGHPLLREAALEAAREWRFKPTEVDAKPVKVQGTLAFNFTLKDQASNEQPAPPPPPPLKSKTESLGKQVIEGLEAEGTRTTFTIPAGQIGNERAIEIVSEQWYSPELQTVVMSRQSDPRSGETTYRLTSINRSEPARSLFEVPADYTIKEEPGRAGIRLLEEKMRMRKPENDN